jgi:hypothetical protein
VLTTDHLTSLIEAIACLDPEVDDAERVTQLGLLETVKSAAAAAQARVTVAFDTSRRQTQREQGVPTHRVGRGIAEQVALARRESPHAGRGTSGWRKPWSTRCRTPWPRCRSGT